MIIRCVFLLIFICSCGNKTEVNLERRKKIPESNQMFLISSRQNKNENIDLKLTQDSSFFNKPRRNIFARHGGVVNSFNESIDKDSSVYVKKNESGAEVFDVKAEQKKEKIDISYQINDEINKPSQTLSVRKIQSKNIRSVVLDEYSSENEAMSNAVAATTYTGEKFNIKQMPNGKFAVKLDGVEKKKAYAVANLGLKIGYENIRVVY